MRRLTALALARFAPLLFVTALVAGCSTAPILANAPAPHPGAPSPSPAASRLPDPQPVVLPLDDGAHHRLTEWWYYTGHLRDVATGRWYGFEDVVFRAERGDFPVSWASHLAITDESGGRFVYAQRSQVGPGVDVSASAPAVAGSHPAFAFALTGLDPSRPETLSQPAWTMAGGGGRDALSASLSPSEATAAGSAGGLGLALSLSSTKPVALHGGDGWIAFGPAGGSYYYSRTRMAATGTLVLDGAAHRVEGSAWFDHQWGDFISVGGGGWDWFAVDLDDGTDLTLSLVRAADGTYPLVYGTLVAADGSATHLPASAFRVEPTGRWTSPRTRAAYPSGWRISVASAGLSLDVTPTVRDQELDTRPTTGVIYWEGSQLVTGTHDARPVTGRGYVELTGYAPAAG
ncbi:MAG TPA: lipocalin family protein [Candidatus Dormibacteraeota bacterium]|nr:lipocalin family protein [Candidatus Dormibacteraeota bacterium]